VDAQRKQRLAFCILFIWISNYLLFGCMNYALNSLYGSSDAISCQLGAVAVMALFKNLG
jgi:hypothetical protein